MSHEKLMTLNVGGASPASHPSTHATLHEHRVNYGYRNHSANRLINHDRAAIPTCYIHQWSVGRRIRLVRPHPFANDDDDDGGSDVMTISPYYKSYLYLSTTTPPSSTGPWNGNLCAPSWGARMSSADLHPPTKLESNGSFRQTDEERRFVCHDDSGDDKVFSLIPPSNCGPINSP